MGNVSENLKSVEIIKQLNKDKINHYKTTIKSKYKLANLLD